MENSTQAERLPQGHYTLRDLEIFERAQELDFLLRVRQIEPARLMREVGRA
jgi:hypothetical protein